MQAAIRWIGLTGAGTCAGCLLLSEPAGDSADTDAAAETAAVEIYDQQQAELDEDRSEVLGERADEIEGIYDRLFWLEFPGWDPTLHSMDADTLDEVDYAFSIGPGDAFNYRASKAAVATAIEESGEVVYRAYAIDQSEATLGEAVYPAPTDEQRWWAYAVDGTTTYVVQTGERTRITAFGPDTPGGDVPTPIVTLEEVGVEVGIFQALGIEGDDLLFIESGRLWWLDLGTGRAQWLQNDQQITGVVDFDRDGAFFGAADGLYYFDAQAGAPIDVDARIEAADFALESTTYAMAHLHRGGKWARRGTTVVYVGQTGIFGFDLRTDEVWPILLEPRGGAERLVYDRPQIAGDSIFVQGLLSASGSVGADGPIYRVPLRR